MQNISVGSFQAKTHLPELLRQVENGAVITITKHGKPVAKLIPADAIQVKRDIKAVIKSMRDFQEEQGPTLDGISIRELIEEGRRY